MRFIKTSLWKLVANLTEGIHKNKCKDCSCFLEYESVKDNLVKDKCLSCNKDYSNSNKFYEELKRKFKNIFKFLNNDINKFILLLRKFVYRYDYMDDWKKFNEAKLLEKERFYSNLSMEEITEADYKHRKRFWNKKFGGYYDLYLSSDSLLLANVFENFRKT